MGWVVQHPHWLLAIHRLMHPNFIAKPEDKSFLENAQEALIYQRLGVDKETIAELKAEIGRAHV